MQLYLFMFLKSALIGIFFKCRDVEMLNRNTTTDIVLCAAMISSCVVNGLINGTSDILRWLLEEKMSPSALIHSAQLTS